MTNADDARRTPTLSDLAECFEGVVPAVVATAAADGTPNVTYLSRVRRVDHERIALSNQFFSKTSRNLAENPRASVLLVDPITYAQYRLALVYERTERRGPLFEQLREDVDAVAAISGMQHVFKLRAADVYRVLHIEQIPVELRAPTPSRAARSREGAATTPLAQLSARLSRCADLDTLVSTALDGLAELFGYEHSLLLLLDESGKRLYTIASRGYDRQGVGSEVVVGEGVIGMVAARGAAIRLGNLRVMAKYSRAVRRTFEEHGHVGPGHDIPVPGLVDANSRVAVPAMVLGQLIGVLVVESTQTVAFDETDEALLTVVAGIIAGAVEVDWAQERSEATEPRRAAEHPQQPPVVPADAPLVRFFAVDGSVFVGTDYLIKGVAGRILWSLLQQHSRHGRDEFTNKEVRLDPTLELPEFRDNLESRLILLKRRLDERNAPVRIEKTGRGRFRLIVSTPLRLEAGGASDASDA